MVINTIDINRADIRKYLNDRVSRMIIDRNPQIFSYQACAGLITETAKYDDHAKSFANVIINSTFYVRSGISDGKLVTDPYYRHYAKELDGLLCIVVADVERKMLSKKLDSLNNLVFFSQVEQFLTHNSPNFDSLLGVHLRLEILPLQRCLARNLFY